MEHFIVTERCSTVRMLAREALRGRWKFGIAATLVYNAVIFIPGMILSMIFPQASIISSVYSILITGPLLLGYSIFILCLFRNQNPDISQIFYGLERFGKAIGLYWLIILFVFLWTLVAIPIMIIAVGIPFFWPVALAALIPAMIAAMRYSQAFFILADNPDIGVLESIRRSKMLMAGNKMKYFLLGLSFIGWFALAMVPFFILGFIYGIAGVYDPFAYGTIDYLFFTLVLIVTASLIEIYVYVSFAAFYDLISGNLRPGVVQTTAEVISQDQVTAQEQTAEQVQVAELEQTPEQEQVSEQSEQEETFNRE